MEKKKSFSQRLEAFFAGKGFYIVLFLCVAVIGVSAWVLLTGTGTNVENPADSLEASNPTIATAAPTPTPVPATPEPTAPATGEEAAATQAPETGAAEAPEEETSAVWSEEEVAQTTTTFIWPVSGEIEIPYSVTTLLYNRTMADWRTHDGIDIAAELGAQVMAAGDGRVESVYTDDLYGVTVVIDHYGGLKSVYANLADTPVVAEGDSVVAGEIIGAVGTTALCEIGEVTHLHFAMTQDGQSVDPGEYLP